LSKAFVDASTFIPKYYLGKLSKIRGEKITSAVDGLSGEALTIVCKEIFSKMPRNVGPG
jgi:hypothetical protein